MKFEEEVLEALRKVQSAPTPEVVAFIKNYMKSELDFLGLTVPLQRQVAKLGFSFSKEERKKALKIWDQIWKRSRTFEVMSQALLHVEKDQLKEIRKDLWPIVQKWAHQIENWAHSDSLSKINANLLEKYPTLVFPTLKKWNTAQKPWLRRQSVVSLLYFSNSREKVLPFKKMIPLVERLLEDDHYYVQKGVGWTLRELGNVYPRETRAFLYKHLKRLHPLAFTIAIEKWKASDREVIKADRKALRAKA